MSNQAKVVPLRTGRMGQLITDLEMQAAKIEMAVRNNLGNLSPEVVTRIEKELGYMKRTRQMMEEEQVRLQQSDQ